MFGKKPQLFPIRRSLLSAPALLQEATRRYQLPQDSRCDLIKQGLNDHYLIASGETKHVLRVYRAGWRSEPEIMWELGLLEHLKEAGAPVAAPVKTAAGNWFCIVEAPEGRRYAVLFEYAPGRENQPRTAVPERGRAYGRALATVHNAAESYTTAQPRGGIDLYALLHAPVQALEPRLTDRPEDLTYLRDLSDRLRDSIVEMDNRGLSRGICHGDPHGGNAHVDARGEFTFFDFDFAAQGWRAYDLGTYRWGLQKNLPTLQVDISWQAFLEGYRDVRDLPRADEIASATFVGAREIWLLGVLASNGDDIGYYLLNDHSIDASIQFLKDWDARNMTGASEAEAGSK